MNAEFWVAFSTGVVALIALITSSASAARARVKTIEDAYVARYWQILDQFPAQALIAEEGTSCAPEELKAARLYLRLCEDELELRQLGWVSRNTWRQWSPGIQAQLALWPVTDEWALIREGQRAPHQFALLRQLATHSDYDPSQPRSIVHRLAKIWRGL
ncbi:hypothetical protein [Streptomyces pseudovenezuelae]|uniref:Uncharacterized protein n=1 Tax=Streptomyces pseudovenezuelae TaxID=67350 RepID=A0ABT6M2S1_9ACTN|nr:hypothetical protein [Streptomyces pseudovenezuelae]MDH6222793.1 hypothetical protein [Streptomyces pseudovenezuelae]